MAPEGDEGRSSRLGPEAVARMTFPTSFRGYDPEHVRGFLESIAAELREARDQEIALQMAVQAAEARVEAAAHPDETQLTALLGEETVRVLVAAREAAAEIRAKGEDSVARLLREAQDDVTRMKADAESLLERRTKEANDAADVIGRAAEAAAETTKADAEAAAGALRAAGEVAAADARLEVDRIRAEGEAAAANARLEVDRIRAAAEAEAAQIIEMAKAHGREMVEEALLVRTRVLEDLSRKRKAARVQLERLQAGRERLLESYDIVRRTLDEATNELRGSLVEAKRAADAAARRVEAEAPTTVEQLDAEVAAARDAGLPLVDAGPSEAAFDGELPTGEMVAIEPSAEFEEVRLVSEPAPREPERESEPMAVSEPEREPERQAEPEPKAVSEPEPEREPEPEPVSEVEPVADAVEEIEEVIVVVEETADEETEATTVDVDDLFARIRAARAQEVAKAHEVLADAPAASPVEEPEPEPAVATAQPATEQPAVDETEEYEPAPVAPDDQALLERRDAITEGAEQTAVRKLKRVLADEQNDVLDRLRRNNMAALDDLLPPAAEHAERYAVAAAPALADAATGGARFYGNEGTAASIEGLAHELGEALALPLRERIAASLRDAAGDDEALADGVRAAYRDWKTHRVEMHTRDTVFAAFNREMYDGAVPGTPMRWLVDDGGSPCPDAEDNSLAGLVARGDPYPTGHCYPPAHPGCRCLLVPASN